MTDIVEQIHRWADPLPSRSGGRTLMLNAAKEIERLREICEMAPTADINGLTSTERRVLMLISDGHDNAEIARRMYVTERTVESHIRRIYAQLDLPPTVNRRVAAARIAWENL